MVFITVPYGAPFVSSVDSTPLQAWTLSGGGTYTWSATGPGTATFTPQGSTQATSTMTVTEPGSYTVAVEYEKDGQTANAQKGPVVACEADLQMDGVDPSEEDTVGGFLQVGGPRRRVTLHYAPDGPLESHKLTFSVSSHLAVYAAETGGDPLTGNDLEWDDRDPPEGQDNWAEKPSELWLEATAVSGGPQGDSASLNYEGRTAVNTGGHMDSVKITAFNLDMITPAGDPVNAPDEEGDGQNEFTYSAATPGVLTMNLKAHVTPSGVGTQIKDQCLFTVEPIAGSTLAWDAANPGG
jgi:hypothetical protein